MKYFFLIAALYSTTCYAMDGFEPRRLHPAGEYVLAGIISTGYALFGVSVALTEWSCQTNCHRENVALGGFFALGGAGGAVYNFCQACRFARTAR